MRTAALLLMLSVLTALSPAGAEVRTETIRYQIAGERFAAYLAWDDAIEGKRPGVLVAHAWWGLDNTIRRRTEMLAQLGYVAFALDLYGEGRSTEHPEQAQTWQQAITANVGRWQERAQRALTVLRERPEVDGSRLAALGYCFGGATVMRLAYSGAELTAAISFHGPLSPPTPEEAQRITARLLAYHGAPTASCRPSGCSSSRAASMRPVSIGR